jgi:hypothetical protein
MPRMTHVSAPGAANALDTLRLLARHAGPMPAAAIARDLNLPRSYRLSSACAVMRPRVRRSYQGPAPLRFGAFGVRTRRCLYAPGASPKSGTRRAFAPRCGGDAQWSFLHLGRETRAVLDRGPCGGPSGSCYRRRRPPACDVNRERSGDVGGAPVTAGYGALVFATRFAKEAWARPGDDQRTWQSPR